MVHYVRPAELCFSYFYYLIPFRVGVLFCGQRLVDGRSSEDTGGDRGNNAEVELRDTDATAWRWSALSKH